MAACDPNGKPTFTRREALVALAAARGYALGANPIPARAITTDTRGLVVGTVDVPGAEGARIPVHEARPDRAGEFPVVVVISEVFGLAWFWKPLKA